MILKAHKLLGKLKGRSVEELRVRLLQAVAVGAERSGLTSRHRIPDHEAFFSRRLASSFRSRINSPSDLLAHFRVRKGPRFFAGLDDPGATASTWAKRSPACSQDLIERANRILEGRFDLLGFKELSFGTPILWNLEPIARKRTPMAHWSELDYLDPEIAGDKKITWELNRHQHFLVLGRAYALSGDERYATCFADQVSDWMDANPPKFGINWASSLEVALRAISWIWALYFFALSPALDREILTRMVKHLEVHGRHLEANLSIFFSPNTHLTGEALGLFYIGIMLPELRSAVRWRKLGRRLLLEALPAQVLQDGVHFEQSAYYHRYTTDFYIHFVLLSKLNGDELPADVGIILAQLLDFLLFAARPDGLTPSIGDDDGGRVVTLGEVPSNDFRPTLCSGAVLLNRGDFKFAAATLSEETMWLLGPQSLNLWNDLASQQPGCVSRAFEASGYYLMREAWSQEASYALIDCGPHGTMNCGHAHADALAVEIAVCGRSLLVDPGTYTYTGSERDRRWFRSTGAHNAITVDGRSSSEQKGAFTWDSVARARANLWLSHSRFDFFSGEHDGFERLNRPVRYRRSVLLLKGRYFVICDKLRSEGPHRYEQHFHFPPGLEVRESDSQQALLQVSDRQEECASVYAASSGGFWRLSTGWVSSGYGTRRIGNVAVFTTDGVGDVDIVTVILPPGSGRVRWRPATHGKALEIARDGYREILLIRNGQSGAIRTRSGSLSTDADWLWASFTQDTKPAELIIINGQNVELDSAPLFQSAARDNFAVVNC